MMKPIVIVPLIIFLSLMYSQASAAVVTFSGAFTAGSGIFGSVPLPDGPAPYLLTVNFTESPNFASITNGSFTSKGSIFSVQNGSISIVENGVADDSLIFVNLTGPVSGALSLRLVGDAVVDSNVTASNLNALIAANTFSNPISANFADGSNYSGSVVAVPEPSTGALCALGVALGAFKGWRNKRRRGTV